MKHDTDEENFWAGEFGDDYIDRNKGNNLLAANLDFFLCKRLVFSELF